MASARTQLVVAAVLAVLCLGAVPQAAAAAADSSPVVLCHDAGRELVQAKLRHACAGRIVTQAEADRIRDRARRARVRAVLGAAPRRAPPAGRGTASGSGVVVGAHGHVVTAAHVVAGCRRLDVHLDPGAPPVAGTVLARAGRADLALVRVAGPTPLRVPIATTWRAVGGDAVVAAGHPARGRVTIRPVRAPGTVVGLHRHADWPAPRLLLRMAVRHGHSGGPLLTPDGRLVGIVVAKVDTPEVYRRTGTLATDIAVAEPIAAVRDLLRRIDPAHLRSGRVARDLAEATTAVVRISCARS